MHKRVVLTVAAAGVMVISGARVASQSPSGTGAGAVPTFAADIAPVVYANCAPCHRPGQAAPFPLLSYEDVKKRGELIAEVTASRYMPPWHASRAEGFPEFRDERRLSDTQLDTMQRWVKAGMPAGDLSRAPRVPTFPEDWSLGRPDIVVPIPRAIDVPAAGRDLYRNVVLPIDFPDDKWIRAIDFDPSARSVVHHALYFVAPAGADVRDDQTIPGLALGGGRGGRGGGGIGAAADAWGGLGGWVPGVTPRFYPEGIAQPLPRRSDLVIQLHLHPSGKPEQEQGRVALYFASEPPRSSLLGVQVPPAFGIGAGIDIPAGEKRFVIRDTFALPVAVEAHGVRGHAHYLAREMKMTATLPDGSTKGLLWIADWDFGWQDSYFYKAPFRLPAETTIEVEIVYDNSSDNLRNPRTPPQRVRWGRESFDEMGSMSLLVAPASAADAAALRAAQNQHLRQQLMRRAGR